jgi:nitroimidazol reductase NimA-like FMN-containing flavoprotein (pyridoxamine 5'-phosphate oxidase superfamily)
MTRHRAPDVPEPPIGGDDLTTIERIDETQCWALLAKTRVGRLGVIVDGAAEIYPVNYIVDRGSSLTPTLLFRTGPGTKLAGLAQHPRVSLEVDDLDTTDHTGWSILVKGYARQVRAMGDAEERDRIEQIQLDHWYAGPKRHAIRLVPTEVTGRRISRRDTLSLGRPPL